MSNMGYCRFQNTVTDLRDCAEYIHDTELSEDEFKARQELIEICQQIIEESQYD